MKVLWDLSRAVLLPGGWGLPGRVWLRPREEGQALGEVVGWSAAASGVEPWENGGGGGCWVEARTEPGPDVVMWGEDKSWARGWQ